MGLGNLSPGGPGDIFFKLSCTGNLPGEKQVHNYCLYKNRLTQTGSLYTLSRCLLTKETFVFSNYIFLLQDVFIKNFFPLPS
jgi:hypothetical protein